MQSGYLSFRESTIHYLKHGSGKKILICFHGYGESASNFNFLADKLENEFFLIALDLPFHGETNWADGTFDEKILAAIINEILKKENLNAKAIHLLGFSLGGRLALALFEEMPQQVERLVLLAPDGLKLNFWYWLSTQTWLGNKSFQMDNDFAWLVLGLLRVGNRVQLINRSIYKFVEYYIHDAQVRQELYHRWTTMRRCKPSLSKIRTQVKEYNVKVRLLYGKHDRIILASPALRFIQDLKNANISILECGHQVLHAKNADHIVDALIN